VRPKAPTWPDLSRKRQRPARVIPSGAIRAVRSPLSKRS
jgi:hypothetical protein